MKVLDGFLALGASGIGAFSAWGVAVVNGVEVPSEYVAPLLTGGPLGAAFILLWFHMREQAKAAALEREQIREAHEKEREGFLSSFTEQTEAIREGTKETARGNEQLAAIKALMERRS